MAEITAPYSLCVYCGSRLGDDPAFSAAATEVGHWLGAQGGQLVYGGGRNGLMGVVAKAVREAGGRVVGIIPQSLVDKELADPQCDELHIVQTMHERKALMAERCDAFLALPGGIGTFEELFEVWSWRQLDYHANPIGLLNVAGYYDGLWAFLTQSVRHGFVSEWQLGLVDLDTEALPLLERLQANANKAPPPSAALRSRI